MIINVQHSLSRMSLLESIGLALGRDRALRCLKDGARRICWPKTCKKSPVFGSCHQTSGWSPDLHGSVFEIAVRNLEPVEIQSLCKM